MTNLDARLAGYHSPVLSAFRVIFGLLYTLHGSMKLFGWPLGEAVPVGTWPFWWAGLIEFVLGIMITLGFLTRIATFIASGEMAFAYFYQHWPPLKGGGTASFWPFAPQLGGNGGELVVMFCFAFLLIATSGAGGASVDARRRPVGRRTTGAPPRRVDRATATDAPPRRRSGLFDRFRR
jgi:putative oxidoreductase